MEMSEREILSSFQNAKNKKKQIIILSQLNDCTVEEIRDVLRKNGVNGRNLPRNKGTKEKTERFSLSAEKAPSDVLFANSDLILKALSCYAYHLDGQKEKLQASYENDMTALTSALATVEQVIGALRGSNGEEA